MSDKLSWDDWFFKLALTIAEKSKDRSTKVGCIAVGPDHEILSVGYNGFPRGVDDSKEEWHERPKKYLVTAHAELNTVCNAARTGTSLKGCTIYVTLPPCARCVLALVQAGVSEVKFIDSPAEKEDRWKEEFEIGKEIMNAANILWWSKSYG